VQHVNGTLHHLSALVAVLAKGGGAAVSGAGIATAFGLLLPMEAGIPIPIPSDLLMLFVGQRAGAGDIPVWVAVLALEAITVAGTTALFLLVRGPAGTIIGSFGPKLGFTRERRARVEQLLERRGRGALFIGRTTPGLRTVTVVGAAATGMPAARALPPLLLGSTLFIQGHVLLGFLLGPLAEDALKSARGPVLLGLGVLAVLGAILWVVRRGRRGGPQAWTEASCPACLAVSAFSGRGERPV
jgi:membrane protein DedA with SNARE-associated domain